MHLTLGSFLAPLFYFCSMKVSNQIYQGATGRESLFDLEIPPNYNGYCVVFTHGFMGFKDWGAWHLVQAFFVAKGFAFCRYNLSHNGGTIHQALDFPDETAFGENTYSKELFDLQNLLSHLQASFPTLKNFHLIGHSRGGATTLLAYRQLKTRNSELYFAIRSLSLWASISSIESRFPLDEAHEIWKKEGVRYIINSRTKQQLPQFFSLYEDFERNVDGLIIEKACKNLSIPVFIAHGDKDTSVSIAEGKELSAYLQQPLHVLKNTDHVFGAQHPWTDEKLPQALEELCEKTEQFLRKS